MRRRPRLLLTVAVLVIAGVVPAVAAPDPADLPAPDLARFVDPLIGTFAPGFTVPGASVPHGMVQVSPDTRGPLAYSGYLYHDPLVEGFSLVHLNGPGVKKAGDLPFMPTVGPVLSSDPKANASLLDHVNENAAAGNYQLRLPTSGVNVELTATERVGLQRYTFPPVPQANVLLDVSRSIEGVHYGEFRVTSPTTVEGMARGRYPVHFVAEFSRPFSSSGTWMGAALTPGGTSVAGDGAGGWLTFDALSEREVTVKVGVSFVDLEGARRNLAAEAGGRSFDDVRADARRAWNEALAKVQVSGGTDLERRSFYTALYHAQTHPNVFSDVDGRYRGFDNLVHVADDRVQYANFSSWDTYKAQNQLLATISPDRYVDMIRSLLADAREGGKLPRWGEQNLDASHMSGDPAIPMIVDGFCRGLLSGLPAEDRDELYAEMVELADVRREQALKTLGYLPLDVSSRGAGTTLEYGVADFALALMADGLGRSEDAQRWLAASDRWRHLFDPSTGWIRPRNSDGSWHEPFWPTDQTGFQEGNSWQYSWLAPHDTAGILDAMGRDVARSRLDEFFTLPAEVQNRLTLFGLVYRFAQYAPGNEHDLQVPWQYVAAGEPWKAQRALRDIQSIFRPTPDGLPGNDDLGSLSAWHVLSAIGLGPITPGAPLFVIGSPLFERVEIRASARAKPFVIEAPGASVTSPFVQSVSLKGRTHERVWLPASALRPGSTLRIEMGPLPNTSWGAGADAAPPSTSTHPLAAFGCAP